MCGRSPEDGRTSTPVVDHGVRSSEALDVYTNGVKPTFIKLNNSKRETDRTKMVVGWARTVP